MPDTARCGAPHEDASTPLSRYMHSSRVMAHAAALWGAPAAGAAKQWSRLFLACALLAGTALVSADALACDLPPPSEHRPTQAQRYAAVDQVFTGKIIAVEGGHQFRLDLRIAVEDNLKGRSARQVQATAAVGYNPCPMGLGFLQAGQWWTFYVKRNRTEGTFEITDVDTFCPKGARPTPGGAGSCSNVLTRAIALNGVHIDAGSEVVLGPERSMAAIVSARLQGRSSLAGLVLPPGTEWIASADEFVLPSKTAIGPVVLSGRIRLVHVADRDAGGGSYQAQRVPSAPGELSLDGVPVQQVTIGARGNVVREALLAKPAVLQGIHVMDRVTFAPDGKIAHFRSGRDQAVGRVRLKRCDEVDLVNGRVAPGILRARCGTEPAR